MDRKELQEAALETDRKGWGEERRGEGGTSQRHCPGGTVRQTAREPWL